jgi:hypothetical protein
MHPGKKSKSVVDPKQDEYELLPVLKNEVKNELSTCSR